MPEDTALFSNKKLEPVLDMTFADIPAGKHAMAIMGQEGDSKVIWDPSKPDEVEAAKMQFEHLLSKKYKAYYAEGDEGNKGKEMKSFDPKAGRILFHPAIVGG